MSEAPKDCLGSDLREGDIVVWWPDRPVVCKVIKCNHGGLSTPEGKSPAQVRIAFDMTINTMPGQRIPSLCRMIDPLSSKMLEQITNQINKP